MVTGTKQIALLANPTAGKGRGARFAWAALQRFRDAGWSVRALQGEDADEALDLARGVVADGVDALVVCGGDGMANLALQATALTGTPLGLIPAGTGLVVLAAAVGLRALRPEGPRARA